jgi:AcrR family transcriptional regulator
MVQNKKRLAAKAGAPAEPKRRGRPRAYEPAVALGQALALFRRDGFAATSLDDLSAATGMNRPSLYGAFGDKRELYIKAYQRYREDYGATVVEIFKADLPIRERLRQFYDAALDIYLLGGEGPRGCFTVMTVASDAIVDPEIRAMVLEGFQDLDKAFAWCFRTAVEKGELPKSVDIAVLAQMASATLYSLAIRARAGIPRKQLEAIVKGAVELLCGSKAS